MLDWTQLAIAWGLTLALTLIVAAIMRRPLFAVLQFICGTDIGARFWTAYSSIMIVTGPLFLVSLGALGTTNLADFVRHSMVLISLGLIGTVMIMGLAVRTASRQMPQAPQRLPASHEPAE
jgi:surface polysaccharide O-acyltransferase-like enzyme